MKKRQLVIALCAVSLLVMVLEVMAGEKPTKTFQDAMKSNGATLQKLGKDADAKDYDAIAADAATFKKNFSGPIAGLFTEKKMSDAGDMCKKAFGAADDLEKAAKAKNEMAVADARKAVQGS